MSRVSSTATGMWRSMHSGQTQNTDLICTFPAAGDVGGAWLS